MTSAIQASPARPTITVTTDGPYMVANELPVIRSRIVESEHGEPMTWQTTSHVDTGAVVALCRCGASARKPFCDGTHTTIGFDGAEAAPDGTYDERADVYPATGMVMRDDRNMCVHAGFCGNRVTDVWQLAVGDATDDSITRTQLIDMILKCPSGALTFRLEPDGSDVEPELRSEVAVVDDGPLLLTGGVAVVGATGERYEVRNRETLCRCGVSAIKPFCDGAHRGAGFVDHL
jgi:CDGSH-type Zn-finger protein